MDLDDSVLNDAMDAFDDDSQLNAVMDAFETKRVVNQAPANYEARERQREWQRNLIEQLGGVVDPNTQGSFEFDLTPISHDLNRRYGIDKRRYRVNIRQTGNIIDRITPALRDGLQRAVQRILDNRNLPNNHRLFFDIFSERFAGGTYRGNGLLVGDWRNDQQRVDNVFNHLQEALNSNESFQMDDTFRMEVTTVAPRTERGRGKPRRYKRKYQGAEKFINTSKLILQIKNKDELCAARAIVAAMADADLDANSPLRRSLCSNSKAQRVKAYLLLQQAGVPEGSVGPEELAKFQAVLPDYQLICIYASQDDECVAFSPYHQDKKRIILYHRHDHYDVCTSLKGFHGTSYACNYCLKGYNNEGKHRCEATKDKYCKCCRQFNCPDFLACHPQGLKATFKCGQCLRHFYSQTCYENHQKFTVQRKEKPSDCVCFNVRRCKKCGKLCRCFNYFKKHRCGHACCPHCKKYTDLAEHKCYIESTLKRKREQKQKRQNKRARREAEEDIDPTDFLEPMEGDSQEGEQNEEPVHVYFDIEAQQGNGTHEANLLVYQCSDSDDMKVIHGSNCVKEFVEDLEELTHDDKRNVIVIAHNLQAYDGYFVIKQYYRNGQEIKQIRSGAKILEIKHFRIRFIDSLNFFQMALSEFPKTFGLPVDISKGYFPHLVNLPENENYVGPLPDKHYYMPNTMSAEAKAKFDAWYEKETQENAVFDFARDIVEYCKMDVNVLKQGCEVFQKLFIENTGFNPFEHVTLASACSRDLIENLLYPETIASEPPFGWNGKLGNQSKEALEWLYWLDYSMRKEANENMEEGEREVNDLMEIYDHHHPHPCNKNYIKHVGNGGEHYVQYINATVDGYCEDTNTIYQYHGCFWHGCESCYRNRTETHQR